MATRFSQRDLYIGITDRSWYEFLYARKPHDEVNFWKPSTSRLNARLGAPFLFKLRAPINKIVGVGFFELSSSYRISDAWEFFSHKNGAPSLDDFLASIRRIAHAPLLPASHEIGSILLSQPIFFDEPDWIPAPVDWPMNTQNGMYYDMNSGEGARVWTAVQARIGSTLPPLAVSYGNLPFGGQAKPALYLPRQGQGTFRAVVLDAYDRRCAITGERTIPVLDAAHITPFSELKRHELSNGVALRSDVHRLFDLGYVSIRPDNRFVVSPHLRDDFSNGKIYYEMHEREIRLPESSHAQPKREALEYHYDNVFRK